MQDLMLDLPGIILLVICCVFKCLQRGNVGDCGDSLSLVYIKLAVHIYIAGIWTGITFWDLVFCC